MSAFTTVNASPGMNNRTADRSSLARESAALLGQRFSCLVPRDSSPLQCSVAGQTLEQCAWIHPRTMTPGV